MSGFVKLDCAILNSSLWVDHAARDIFITALLLAEPREFAMPLEQLSADGSSATGFVVPPGFYGFIPAAGPGIVRQSGLDIQEGTAALRRLGEPDADSRSQEYGGRRLVRVNGGYIALNYSRYRDHDYSAAKRMKLYRQKRQAVTPNTGERERNASVTRANASVTRANASVTEANAGERERNVTHAEAEADNSNIFVPLSRHQPKNELTPKRQMSVRDALVVRSLRDGTLCTLSPQDLAKCVRLLWKPTQAWSPHTLGAILYAVACHKHSPLRDLAVFAKGCANGKSGARGDFDSWAEVAAGVLRSKDAEAEGQSDADTQRPTAPGAQERSDAGAQVPRGDE